MPDRLRVLSPIIPHAVTAPIISCTRLRDVRARTAPTLPGDAGTGTALIGMAHAPGLTVVAEGAPRRRSADMWVFGYSLAAAEAVDGWAPWARGRGSIKARNSACRKAGPV
jgi:hypothetical protein